MHHRAVHLEQRPEPDRQYTGKKRTRHRARDCAVGFPGETRDQEQSRHSNNIAHDQRHQHGADPPEHEGDHDFPYAHQGQGKGKYCAYAGKAHKKDEQRPKKTDQNQFLGNPVMIHHVHEHDIVVQIALNQHPGPVSRSKHLVKLQLSGIQVGCFRLHILMRAAFDPDRTTLVPLPDQACLIYPRFISRQHDGARSLGIDVNLLFKAGGY